ncbi:MAG TPA: UDP-4-amino-4,6-dideoxy-N-acetyl-beta-L-altrosamine transaminase [Bacillota bacterium]|nr:UDP-4-amino-4,6-dideoxy-N-acetyl-beta-L-altrosamine transaminase [Bacillota bacterium]
MTELAIHGGKPVRDKLLPYGHQWIDEQDIAAVVEALKSDFLTQGPQIARFEQKVADYAGVRYGVAFANGTAALHGACFAAGIQPGDEAITTPITFAATSNAVIYQGGTPVFADIDPTTYLLDVAKAEKAITSRTKAILPVDYSGQPVDMEAFRALARRHNLVFIQDAAHSLGASEGQVKAGHVADMTMFSFHPVKPVTTGEGGIIVTDSRDYYEKLLLFRSHGITRDPARLTRNEGPWYYEMQYLGYNYRMTDIQAALGNSQLDKLDTFIAKRNRLADYYLQKLAVLESQGLLVLPHLRQNVRSGWHLFVIRLGLERLKAGRREVFEALQKENIGVNVHYIPVHLHPYYVEKYGDRRGLCPVAEAVYEGIITLPLYPLMEEQDVDDVIAALEKILNYYKK